MLLFVRKGCDFCKGLPVVRDLKIFEVSQTSKGPMMMVEGKLIPGPEHVRGLPALLVGTELTMGKTLVRERLEKIAGVVPEAET